jgi:hypothetical protein
MAHVEDFRVPLKHQIAVRMSRQQKKGYVVTHLRGADILGPDLGQKYACYVEWKDDYVNAVHLGGASVNFNTTADFEPRLRKMSLADVKRVGDWVLLSDAKLADEECWRAAREKRFKVEPERPDGGHGGASTSTSTECAPGATAGWSEARPALLAAGRTWGF